MERKKNKLYILNILKLIYDSTFTIKRFNVIFIKNGEMI